MQLAKQLTPLFSGPLFPAIVLLLPLLANRITAGQYPTLVTLSHMATGALAIALFIVRFQRVATLAVRRSDLRRFSMAAGLVVLWFSVWILCAAAFPQYTEEFEAAAVQTTTYINLTAVLLICMGIAATACWHFGKGLVIDFSGDWPKFYVPKSIDALAETVLPDLMIAARSASDATYQKRVLEMQSSDADFFAIPFCDPMGVCRINGVLQSFRRATPPFLGEHNRDRWTYSIADDFRAETWHDYTKYLNAYASMWAEFSIVQGRLVGATESNILELHVRKLPVRLRTAVLVLAMLCTAVVTAVAQSKSARLHQYLGPERYASRAPAGDYKFTFDNVVLTRHSDGTLRYDSLLRAHRGFSDADNAGALIAVQRKEGDRWIVLAPDRSGSTPATPQPAPVRNTPSIDPVRPRPLFDGQQPTQPTGGGFHMPDSATIAIGLQNSTEAIDRFVDETKKVGPQTRTFFGVVWDRFSEPVFLWAVFCYFIAKIFAGEMALSVFGDVIYGYVFKPIVQVFAGMQLICAAFLVGYALWHTMLGVNDFAPRWIAWPFDAGAASLYAWGVNKWVVDPINDSINPRKPGSQVKPY